MSDSSNITSRPWDNIAAYEDAEWHEIWRSFFDGSEERGPLLNWANEFAVSQSSPVGMSVDVATGAALVGGVWCKSTASQTLTVAANTTGATRYDLVFLHWTRTNQAVQIRVVDGSATDCSLAVAPATNAIGTYQTAGPPMTQWAIPLACLEVQNGATQILDAHITDLREYCRFRTEPYDLCDNSTIDLNSSYQMQVADAGVGVDQISSAIAGDGLTGGDGAALDVVPDGVTLEINADQLRIVGGGVSASIRDDRTRYIWLGANDLHEASGVAPTWGTLAGLPVCAEGWIMDDTTNDTVIGHVRAPADCSDIANNGQVRFVYSHNETLSGKQIQLIIRWSIAYECDDDISVGTSVYAGTIDLDPAEAGYRLCNTITGGGTGIPLRPDYYTDFYAYRAGAGGVDNSTADVLLLGILISYTADM